MMGLTQGDLAPSLYFSLNGINAGSLKDATDTHDIKVKYADFQGELDPQMIMNTAFPSTNGQILLGSVGSYHLAPSTSNVTRENGQITVSLQSNLEKGYKAESIKEQLFTFAEKYDFPVGIDYYESGEMEDNSELLGAMLTTFIFAVICIFGILVLQFNSYTQPGIIMYSVIMGFLGATYGMVITGYSYGMLFLI